MSRSGRQKRKGNTIHSMTWKTVQIDEWALCLEGILSRFQSSLAKLNMRVFLLFRMSSTKSRNSKRKLHFPRLQTRNHSHTGLFESYLYKSIVCIRRLSASSDEIVEARIDDEDTHGHFVAPSVKKTSYFEDIGNFRLNFHRK